METRTSCCILSLSCSLNLRLSEAQIALYYRAPLVDILSGSGVLTAIKFVSGKRVAYIGITAPMAGASHIIPFRKLDDDQANTTEA